MLILPLYTRAPLWSVNCGASFGPQTTLLQLLEWQSKTKKVSNCADLTDILYHRHRETIASLRPDPEVVGLGYMPVVRAADIPARSAAWLCCNGCAIAQ